MVATLARPRMYFRTLGFVLSFSHTCPPRTRVFGVENMVSFAASSATRVARRLVPAVGAARASVLVP